MDAFDTLKVCVAYEAGGVQYKHMPYHQSVLHQAVPVYAELPGWKADLTNVTTIADLPSEALDFIGFLSEQVGVNVTLVGVGPARSQFVRFVA